jgi:hypothetical protein
MWIYFNPTRGGAVVQRNPKNKATGRANNGAESRENEEKALSLWIKGATYQQIATAGFGITSARGAGRSVRRALARIPKQEADQAREAQLARLQALRLLLWNHAGSDPIRAAQALIKLEAREARLLGLDMPTRIEAAGKDGEALISIEAVDRLMAEADGRREGNKPPA